MRSARRRRIGLDKSECGPAHSRERSPERLCYLHIMRRTGLRLAEGTTMHDRDPFRPPAREPKPGTFHRPAHAFGIKHGAEAAELRLSGPMSGEQKLGEGVAELPLLGQATRTIESRRETEFTRRRAGNAGCP